MSNLLNNLKAQREERVQDLHLDLPIPTWDRSLVARFNVLDRRSVEKFANQKRSTEADLDFVISATRELYLHDPERLETEATRMAENGEYVRLEDEIGTPIKFELALAEKLGEPDLKSARVVLLFCVKNNSLAIGGLASRLIMWMQNTDAEVAEALVGEF